MSLHVFMFVFLLVVCHLILLALLWQLDWFALQPSSARGGAKRSRFPGLLKPRSPDDCPACRLGSTASSGEGLAPAAVRPWSEVKSRRGAPKRINTEGFACPNRQCRYFGNTNAHFHAASGRWQAWPCRAHPDVPLSSVPHHLQRTLRHAVIPAENVFPPSRCGGRCTGRRAGSIGGRSGLRLPASHHHEVADSCWQARTDLTRADLLPSVAPAHPTGRNSHPIALLRSRALAVAGHRS